MERAGLPFPLSTKVPVRKCHSKKYIMSTKKCFMQKALHGIAHAGDREEKCMARIEELLRIDFPGERGGVGSLYKIRSQ